jgi:hypothetical protein
VHVFIDESGTFSGYHDLSLNVVGALTIPSSKLPIIEEKYAKLRPSLPIINGEVKGRLLNESQVDRVVRILAKNEAIFEVTVLDLGLHAEAALVARKHAHAQEMLSRVNRFSEANQAHVRDISQRIVTISLPLYLQAVVTFETLHAVIGHVPVYFAQRRPKELSSFTWIIDGKDPRKVTNWEAWWPAYATGALSTMSKSRPSAHLIGADYSHFARFDRVVEIHGRKESATDLPQLLADLRFSARIEPGLELADIVVNAMRRALVGSLGIDGWKNIPRLMIHRPESYIQFVLLTEGPSIRLRTRYANVVMQHFMSGGRSMLAPRFLREALASEE